MSGILGRVKYEYVLNVNLLIGTKKRRFSRITGEENLFYVYLYLDPNKPIDNEVYKYEPFYVGKGKGRRAKSFSDRKNYLRHKLNLMDKVIVFIYENSLSEKEAFSLEDRLIEEIGRKILGEGPLVNLSKGGQGVSGKRCSDQYRKIRSEISKKLWSNADFREKTVKAQIDGWTEEAKARNSRSHKGIKNVQKGVPWNEERKLKMSLISKSRWSDPEYKDRQRKSRLGRKSARKGKIWSKEYIQIFKERSSGSNNPMYGKHHSEESKRKMRESAKRKEIKC